MDTSALASLAASLLDNEAFTGALNRIRDDARDGLGKVNPTDPAAIIRLQAVVAVADALRDNLGDMIRAGTPRKNPGIA